MKTKNNQPNRHHWKWKIVSMPNQLHSLCLKSASYFIIFLFLKKLLELIAKLAFSIIMNMQQERSKQKQ